MEIRRLSRSEWESALPDTGLEFFHLPQALDVIDVRSPGDLVLLGGYEGQELVAMLPLVVREFAMGVSLISSPPPGLHVPYAGPLLMTESPKRRRQDTLNQAFVSNVLDTVGLDSRTFCFIACSPDYHDPRPFEWNGLAVSTSFTYRLEVDTTPDELITSFSRGRRREVNQLTDLDLQVGHEGLDAAETIYRESRARLEEEDAAIDFDWSFVREFVSALEARSRVYVARSDGGTFHGGIIVLYSNDTGYFWLGGTRASVDGLSVNSLLHWQIMRDIAEDPGLASVSTYDLVGAGIPRLASYKATFNPSLRPYYVVKSAGVKQAIAEKAYELMHRIPGG